MSFVLKDGTFISANPLADLLGLTSIALILLFTLYIALRWPDISKIIYIALFVRVFTLLYGHYISPLPDSTADAETLELVSANMGHGGFLYVLSQFRGPDPRFISWLIAIPYSLFGRSILLAKSISLFFGMGTVFFGWLLAQKVWNKAIANKVGWTIALFPSLILYSVLTLREVYITFFTVLILYGIVTWAKTKSFKSIVLTMIGFLGATFFHGAMFVGGFVFLIIVGVSNLIFFF